MPTNKELLERNRQLRTENEQVKARNFELEERVKEAELAAQDAQADSDKWKAGVPELCGGPGRWYWRRQEPEMADYFLMNSGGWLHRKTYNERRADRARLATFPTKKAAKEYLAKLEAGLADFPAPPAGEITWATIATQPFVTIGDTIAGADPTPHNEPATNGATNEALDNLDEVDL